MEKYILQKDFPDAKAGTVVTWSEGDNAFVYEKGAWVSPHRYNYLTKGAVVGNPEWFLPFKEFNEKSPMQIGLEQFRKYNESYKTTIEQAYEIGWKAAEKHFKSQQ